MFEKSIVRGRNDLILVFNQPNLRKGVQEWEWLKIMCPQTRMNLSYFLWVHWQVIAMTKSVGEAIRFRLEHAHPRIGLKENPEES